MVHEIPKKLGMRISSTPENCCYNTSRNAPATRLLSILSTSSRSWPQFAGEIGKFITFWCQISWECRLGLPKLWKSSDFWSSYSKRQEKPPVPHSQLELLTYSFQIGPLSFHVDQPVGTVAFLVFPISLSL